MNEIQIFDGTLRDGSHAIKHQLKREVIEDYCSAIDSVGFHTVIVGHGNGLGASSLQVGLSLLSDSEMLKTARENLHKTKLGAFLLPGFGTIEDDIIPALDYGVDLFKIGCHCTEADITRQHIEYLKNKNKEVYGVLMMYHLADTELVVRNAKLMESYGVDGVILMDSAGASTPELVRKTISALKDSLNIKIGFHPHNNLGLAVANAYIAVQEGASIIDGTVRGFGAGAGNLQLEAFVALMQKETLPLNINLYQLLDVSEQIIKPIMLEDRALTDVSIISGMSGVFSAFKVHVRNASKRFGVDMRDIYMELGKRRVVAGQEDMVIQVAKELQRGVNE